MTSLDDLRAELEGIDAELVEVMARRFRVVLAIAGVKAAEGIPVVLPERIAEVQERVAAVAEQHGLDPALPSASTAKSSKKPSTSKTSTSQSADPGLWAPTRASARNRSGRSSPPGCAAATSPIHRGRYGRGSFLRADPGNTAG